MGIGRLVDWRLEIGRLEIGDWGLEIGRLVNWGLEIGDWRLEIGDWRLGIGRLEIGDWRLERKQRKTQRSSLALRLILASIIPSA
ncbi:MAG: hypothetical protein ABIG63_03485 [Chloroflexota bacterium]